MLVCVLVPDMFLCVRVRVCLGVSVCLRVRVCVSVCGGGLVCLYVAVKG